MTKAAHFRRLLDEPGPVLLGGAHDGLSACLAERAGFDGIWASGFCISASKRIADVGLLTMTEFLAAADEINQATSLPVIADVDDGFGDAVNVVRMVREYERAGIAGVSIEDNQHPKRNSLNRSLRSRLVSPAEFAAKLRASKEAQNDPSFVVIARTEALIADLGMEEALRRANTYAEAGADMILIHSRSPDVEAVKQAALRWHRDVPLVAVPTTYSNVTASELYGYGYKMAIFANQGLRAAVKAMTQAMAAMVRTGSPSSVESDLCSLEELFTLTGFDEIRRLESRFIKTVVDGNPSSFDEHVPPAVLSE